MKIKDILRETSFGEQVAEEESEGLQRYFVETNQWERIFRGEVDIVYGRKGVGKSAIYSLLLRRSSELSRRGVIVVPAENPRGKTAFDGVILNPPTTEAEFISIWKLFFLTIIVCHLRDLKMVTSEMNQVLVALSAAKLIEEQWTLSGIFQRCQRYVQDILRSIEGTVTTDPVTGQPRASVVIRPNNNSSQNGTDLQVDRLFKSVDSSLALGGKVVWILIDRLDVAFSESSMLEENALRALFRAYSDFRAFSQVRLKVFLRDDIWRRISRPGFREASHIIKRTTIEWDKETLTHVIVRRALQVPAIRFYYRFDSATVLSSIDQQQNCFYALFPRQVERGRRKPLTMDWIISRTSNGSGKPTPREIIHLINEAVAQQVRLLEIGDSDPEDGKLISGKALKLALPEVSKVHVHQTVFAEYPHLRESLLDLRGEQTGQSPETLAAIWRCDESHARNRANELVEIGLFEERGSKHNPQYWIPFLYRDGLEVVQGNARDGFE